MIRKYHNLTLQTNPLHCEEESQKQSEETKKINKVKQLGPEVIKLFHAELN